MVVACARAASFAPYVVAPPRAAAGTHALASRPPTLATPSHNPPAGGRGGVSGNKFRMALGLPVGAVVNCADNTGECRGGTGERVPWLRCLRALRVLPWVARPWRCEAALRARASCASVFSRFRGYVDAVRGGAGAAGDTRRAGIVVASATPWPPSA